MLDCDDYYEKDHADQKLQAEEPHIMTLFTFT